MIKLTKKNGKAILIGVESIIDVETIEQNSATMTIIQSRHAMVTSSIVKESVDEIYSPLINGE